jgi:hypothetical protein
MQKSLNLLVILAALPLMALSFAAQAQLQYTIADGQVTITNYTGSGGEVTIPSTTNGYPVTAIGTNAFQWSGLSSVTIPDSVTNIGDGAFLLCFSLTSFDVNASNPSYASVSGVLFNKTLTTLIQCPINRAGSSYAIPNSVTSIGENAFANCSLTSVTIPNSVTNIGESAFASCSLTSVTIPNSVTNISDFAFGLCPLTSVTIPNSVTTIGELAFSYNSTLRTVAIPESVTTIGDGAFLDCSALGSMNVNTSNPNYASAGGVLFDKPVTTLIEYPGGRTGSYVIPGSVTTVGEWAFEGCGLTSVTIPASVTAIGVAAFSVCTSLRQVFFQGNAPSANGVAGSADTTVFANSGTGKVYYVPGTTGWGATFGGWPTAQWYQPQPQILPSGNSLGVGSQGFQFTISWATNTSVVVEATTNLQDWTPVSTNTLVSGTSAFVDSTWTNYPKRFYRLRSE